jgi:hypothetical protein
MRASRKDCDQIVAKIEVTARYLGLLPADGELYYQPGNTTQGHSPEIRAFSDAGRHHPFRARFLPENFTYKTTLTEAYRILQGVETALDAVAHLKVEQAAARDERIHRALS